MPHALALTLLLPALARAASVDRPVAEVPSLVFTGPFRDSRDVDLERAAAFSRQAGFPEEDARRLSAILIELAARLPCRRTWIVGDSDEQDV